MLDQVDQPVTEQISSRQIHADLDGQALSAPLRCLAKCLVDDLLGELAHQMRLLSECHEVSGGEYPATRMRPARQCFHADHLSIGQADLGLEVQLDLPAL